MKNICAQSKKRGKNRWYFPQFKFKHLQYKTDKRKRPCKPQPKPTAKESTSITSSGYNKIMERLNM